MHIERDPEFDQLYINFGDTVGERVVAKTTEVFPGVYFDVDSGGKLVGIDIVNTKEVIGIVESDPWRK